MLDSSGLFAAAAGDVIAIIAVETIVEAVVAGQIAVAAVPVVALGSSAVLAAGSIVITAAIPDRRAVRNSFPKC